MGDPVERVELGRTKSGPRMAGREGRQHPVKYLESAGGERGFG